MKTQRYAAIAALALLGIAAGPALPAARDAADNSPRRQKERKLIAVLKSDAPLFDKARACQQLAVVGSRNAVPALAALLDDKALSDYARFGLEPIQDPSVDDALRGAMGRLKGRLLAGVVNSIAVRRDAKAVGGLKKLVSEPASGAASQALAALGRIATGEAIETVRQALTRGPAALRPAAADACLVAAKRLVAQKRTAAAVALYTAVGKADVGEHLKAAAAYHAIVARGAGGARQLVEYLRSPKAAMRNVALRAARAMPAAGVTAALAAELPKSPPPVQVALIELLAERGGAEGRKAIAAAAKRDGPHVQVAAIKALGKIGDGTTVPLLVYMATCGVPDGIEKAAAASLRTIHGKGADEAILKTMAQTGCKGFGSELIEILVARQYAPTVPKLLEMKPWTFEPDYSVTVFKALGALGRPADLPAIIKALDPLDHGYEASVYPHAEKAIALVARRIADPAARADAVLAALAKAGRKPVRCSLIRALGGIGGAKAFGVVAKAAGDADAEVKDAAIRALAGWPDALATPALLKLVKTTDNETHRILALRGYVRLLALDAGGDPRQTVRKYAEAMGLARRADAKKLVLSGLAGAGHPDAMKPVMSCLDDAAIRPEAALAAVSIARATMGADRKQARAAMAKVLAVSKGKPVAAEAQRIIRQIDRFADSITAWRVAGPYAKAGKNYRQLFDIAFAPEQPGAKGVAWRLLAGGTDPKRPRILDLLKAIGGAQRVAYVLTWIHSDKTQPARLELGSDDGVKAWLNGRLVHANNTARAAIPYTDKANVTLKAGWNPLLLKITQNDSPWEFCARLCRRDGQRLDGIRIDCMHEGD